MLMCGPSADTSRERSFNSRRSGDSLEAALKRVNDHRTLIVSVSELASLTLIETLISNTGFGHEDVPPGRS